MAVGTAVSLGNPIGDPTRLETLVREFGALCQDNAWSAAFHQIPPELLPTFQRCGFSVLKIGEEASVPLARFVAETAQGKDFRYIGRRFARDGFSCGRYEPPLTAEVVQELEAISDEWLTLAGRRERGFTLGRWDDHYPRDTVVYVVRSSSGEATAFANLVPSYRPAEVAVDLMRHRVSVANGTMDFLFMEMLTDLHSRGLASFSLGMAPLAGIGEEPGAPIEERATHELYERLNRFFSYKGLYAYKAKFEPDWEARYLAYDGGPLGLARVTLALTRLTEG